LCSHNFCHFVIIWNYKEQYAIKNEKNITCSLRAWYKFDVSKLAEKYGGGGHANASGLAINQHPITFFKLRKINQYI
jgi:nanoRNase/pAp phosphatase (c-di-AMP/oligoRNAs hydrolase)